MPVNEITSSGLPSHRDQKWEVEDYMLNCIAAAIMGTGHQRKEKSTCAEVAKASFMEEVGLK